MSQLEIYRDRFAESGWEIFERGVEETLRRGQKYLGVEHVLYALAEIRAEYFLSLLRSLSENPDAMAMLMELIEECVRVSPRYEGEGVRLAPETILLFKRALAKVRFGKRRRIEATDLFTTMLKSSGRRTVRTYRNVFDALERVALTDIGHVLDHYQAHYARMLLPRSVAS